MNTDELIGVAIPLVCGIGIWIGSRGCARSMAKGPDGYSESSLLLIFRAIAFLALAMALFQVMTAWL